MPAFYPREHEAKFQVAPDTHPALFLQTLNFDHYTVRRLGTLSTTDTYLDTSAYELLRHGVALRVRHQGSTFEVGFKSIQAERKGSIQTRMDMTIPLPTRTQPLDTTTLPAAVLEQLKPYSVKPHHLRPMLVVRQQRQKAKLYPDNNAMPLAEWSLDEVWIEAAASSPPSTIPAAQMDNAHAHFYELEIELLVPDGSDDEQSDTQVAFEALVRQAKERFDLTSVYTSKFVRGLEAEIAHTHGQTNALTSTMTLAQAGRLLLHQQLFQIFLNEHGVRKSTRAHYVHDMRVAIRRARAALQLCQGAFPATSVHPLEKGLMRLGRALGLVRDLDVALGNLRSFRRGQPEALHRGIKLLHAELKDRRSHAHADLITLLDSKKHRKFVVKALRFCDSSTLATIEDEIENAARRNRGTHEIFPVQLRHMLPSRILAAFEAVRTYESAFSDGDLPPLETFHSLRIQAKYLRYLVEFAQHLLGDEGAALAKQLRDLQEHLGELNDAHVEQERLRLWADALQIDSQLRQAIEMRLHNTAAAIDRLASGTPAVLDTLIGYPGRLTLAKAIAHI